MVDEPETHTRKKKKRTGSIQGMQTGRIPIELTKKTQVPTNEAVNETELFW